MKRLLTIITILTVLAGCSTMTPGRYAPSADNNQVLKKYSDEKIIIGALTPPASYDANCRLMGPIKAGDNLTIPQFIQKAFNDELKFADMYDENNGLDITGTVDKIKFSSSDGLTNGWWELAITLNSPNGHSVNSEIRHTFKSGFDAITACNQTAQALGAAVQDLIYRTVTHPEFEKLF